MQLPMFDHPFHHHSTFAITIDPASISAPSPLIADPFFLEKHLLPSPSSSLPSPPYPTTATRRGPAFSYSKMKFGESGKRGKGTHSAQQDHQTASIAVLSATMRFNRSEPDLRLKVQRPPSLSRGHVSEEQEAHRARSQAIAHDQQSHDSSVTRWSASSSSVGRVRKAQKLSWVSDGAGYNDHYHQAQEPSHDSSDGPETISRSWQYESSLRDFEMVRPSTPPARTSPSIEMRSSKRSRDRNASVDYERGPPIAFSLPTRRPGTSSTGNTSSIQSKTSGSQDRSMDTDDTPESLTSQWTLPTLYDSPPRSAAARSEVSCEEEEEELGAGESAFSRALHKRLSGRALMNGPGRLAAALGLDSPCTSGEELHHGHVQYLKAATPRLASPITLDEPQSPSNDEDSARSALARPQKSKRRRRAGMILTPSMLPDSAPVEKAIEIESQRQRWIVRHEKLLSLASSNEEGEQGDYTLDFAPDSSIDAGQLDSRSPSAAHELWQPPGGAPIASFSNGPRKNQHRPAPLDLASAVLRRVPVPQQPQEERANSAQQLALPDSGQFIMVSSPSRTLLKHAEPVTAQSGLVSPSALEDQDPPPSARSVQAILEKQREEMVRFTQKVLKHSVASATTPLSAPFDAPMLPPVSPFHSERPTKEVAHVLKHQSSPPAPRHDESWSWLRDVQEAPLSDSFEIPQVREHRLLPRPESSPQLSTSRRMASQRTGMTHEYTWPEPNFKGVPLGSSPRIAEQHGNDGHSAAIEALIQQLRFPSADTV